MKQTIIITLELEEGQIPYGPEIERDSHMIQYFEDLDPAYHILSWESRVSHSKWFAFIGGLRLLGKLSHRWEIGDSHGVDPE